MNALKAFGAFLIIAAVTVTMSLGIQSCASPSKPRHGAELEFFGAVTGLTETTVTLEDRGVSGTFHLRPGDRERIREEWSRTPYVTILYDENFNITMLEGK